MYKSRLNMWKTITPSELADLDLNDLRYVVKRMSTIANGRLRRLETAGLSDITPAVRSNAYLARNERFELPAKETRQQYRAYYKQLSNFLNAKTSKVTPAKKWYSRQQKLIGELTPEQLSMFWKVYDTATTSNRMSRIMLQVDSNQLVGWARVSFDPNASFMENLVAISDYLQMEGSKQLKKKVQPGINEYDYLRLNGEI